MKKIMMVDDEPDQIFIAKIALEQGAKYEFIGVNSGEHCFELLEDGQIPDLILLDLMMPGMSGWRVLDKLKENSSWKDIPVVFLTARTDELAERAGEFLGDDFIEKPVTAEELKNRIDKILKKQ